MVENRNRVEGDGTYSFCGSACPSCMIVPRPKRELRSFITCSKAFAYSHTKADDGGDVDVKGSSSNGYG